MKQYLHAGSTCSPADIPWLHRPSFLGQLSFGSSKRSRGKPAPLYAGIRNISRMSTYIRKLPTKSKAAEEYAETVCDAHPSKAAPCRSNISPPCVPPNSSLPSNVDASIPSGRPFIGVFAPTLLLSTGFASMLANGCRVMVLLRLRLDRVDRAEATLERAFAGVLIFAGIDGRGFARLGVGPLLDSVEEAVDANEACRLVCSASASSPENGVGGIGSSCVSGSCCLFCVVKDLELRNGRLACGSCCKPLRPIAAMRLARIALASDICWSFCSHLRCSRSICNPVSIAVRRVKKYHIPLSADLHSFGLASQALQSAARLPGVVARSQLELLLCCREAHRGGH